VRWWCTGLALLLAMPACADASSAIPPATAACAAVEFPQVQFGSHLLGGTPPPEPYSSTPPTSGWHASGAPTVGVQPLGDPLSEPEQVSALEAGAVVVTYHDLPEPERQRLEQHVGERFASRVAVTSYDRLASGEVAFAVWGGLQRCQALDLGALDAFVDAFAASRVNAAH
jgi:hypothetical protein